MRLKGRQVKISPARGLMAPQQLSQRSTQRLPQGVGVGAAHLATKAKPGAPLHPTAAREGEGVSLEHSSQPSEHLPLGLVRWYQVTQGTNLRESLIFQVRPPRGAEWTSCHLGESRQPRGPQTPTHAPGVASPSPMEHAQLCCPWVSGVWREHRTPINVNLHGGRAVRAPRREGHGEGPAPRAIRPTTNPGGEKEARLGPFLSENLTAS